MRLRISDYFDEISDELRRNGYSLQNAVTSIFLMTTMAFTTTDSLINKYNMDFSKPSYRYSKYLDSNDTISNIDININDSFDKEEAEYYDWTETVKKLETLPGYCGIPDTNVDHKGKKLNELRKYEVVEFESDKENYYQIFDYEGNTIGDKYSQYDYHDFYGTNCSVLLDAEKCDAYVLNHRTGELSEKIESANWACNVKWLYQIPLIKASKNTDGDITGGDYYLYNFDGTKVLNKPAKLISCIDDNLILFQNEDGFEIIDIYNKKTRKFNGLELHANNVIEDIKTGKRGVISINNIYDISEIIPLTDAKISRFADKYVVTDKVLNKSFSYIVGSDGTRSDFVNGEITITNDEGVAYSVNNDTVTVYDQEGTEMFNYDKKDGLPIDCVGYNRIILEKENTYGQTKYGLIDVKGNKIVNTEYDNYDPYMFFHNSIMFTNEDNVGNLIVDEDNNIYPFNGKTKKEINEWDINTYLNTINSNEGSSLLNKNKTKTIEQP